MAKIKVDELQRLAFIYAEQDRETFIDAYASMEDDPCCVEAKDTLKQLRAYRKKRWGKSKLESTLEEMVEVNPMELMEKAREKPNERQ